jgi:type VI secretion system secreted protein Hcp
MRNNELLSKVVLTVRKAGGTALEYFTVTLENARITLIEMQSNQMEADAMLSEDLRMSYQKINVQYTPQGPDGQARGGMLFVAESGSA